MIFSYILMIFGIKKKIDNFDPYKYTRATCGFVIQGHILLFTTSFISTKKEKRKRARNVENKYIIIIDTKKR